MKRLALIILGCFLCLGIIGASIGVVYAYNSGDSRVNGEGVGQIETSKQLSCEVRDETGTTVTSVRVSDPWGGEVVGYWVYFSGVTWTNATVAIRLMGSELPEDLIANRYSIPGGYSGGTLTPFAITDWSGVSEYGTARVAVKTDAGTAFCTVDIVPY